MIDARELRIGNYFEWSPLASMGKGLDKITHGQQIMDYLQFKDPIQLTEEWLLKFGFQLLTEKRVGTKYSEYGNGQIHYEKRFNLAKHSEKDYWYCLRGSVKIQYVHQLQNLYFALTGEELTIKL